MSKIKTFFICSGLGVINRGYESFTRECFDALRDNEQLDAYLYKGGGSSTDREKKLFNLPRFKGLAKFFGKILKTEGYTVEQFTFCLSLIPHLISKKPDVILVSDFILSTYLYHLRRFLRLKYKILFSNGAPNGPPFHRCEHVQQLLQLHYKHAVDNGTPPQMQSVIPYGIEMRQNKLIDPKIISNIRNELLIPVDAFVIIMVAAVNIHHKRADYLVKEFAQFNHPNSFLIMLGQIDAESDIVIGLAKELLPKNNYMIKSVPHAMVAKYYLAADLFVLTSLSEGLPRVMIEALSFGLPILAHDYNIPTEVLEGNGYLADFTQQHALTKLLVEVSKADINNPTLVANRVEFARNKYSWETLKNDYVEMIKKTAKS